MIRHAATLLLGILAAPPASAECVDLATAPPSTAEFEDGIVIDVLTRDAGMLHYRITEMGQPTVEMKTHLGTVPLWSRRGGSETVFAWDTPLPALADLVPGANFELVGRATPDGNGPTPAALGIAIGEWTGIVIDGCPIRVLRSTLRHGPPDRPVSRSERLWDPVTLLSYETTTILLDGGGVNAGSRTYRTRSLR